MRLGGSLYDDYSEKRMGAGRGRSVRLICGELEITWRVIRGSGWCYEFFGISWVNWCEIFFKFTHVETSK